MEFCLSWATAAGCYRVRDLRGHGADVQPLELLAPFTVLHPCWEPGALFGLVGRGFKVK